MDEDRAIVSDIPGTTRDTVEELLQIEGYPFRLIDTAGIREAQDQIEKMGVERSMAKIKAGAIVVYVFDVIEMKPEEVWDDLKKLELEDAELLVIANKMDLNPYINPGRLLGRGYSTQSIGDGERQEC